MVAIAVYQVVLKVNTDNQEPLWQPLKHSLLITRDEQSLRAGQVGGMKPGLGSRIGFKKWEPASNQAALAPCCPLQGWKKSLTGHL